MHPLLNERPPLVSLSQEDNTDNPFTPPSPGLFSGSTGALLHTQCPTLTCIHQGKVRDIYAISPTTLLMVATDRISALDVVMKNGIPGKGQLLTSLSLFWFDYLKDILPNHVVTSHLHEMPLVIQEYQEMVEHRSMLVRKLRMVPVEAVVRGYLTGALWKAYQKMETYAGLQLPPGLKEGQKLPTPVFTPTTKAKVGDHGKWNTPIGFLSFFFF
ncbi:Bifunctional purine biosynthetic protein ade1 [Coelomomyces lativittatus]|nr:Bifunctional purine biosynthetic protein ade1 [Coelomomyces lativittatus]